MRFAQLSTGSEERPRTLRAGWLPPRKLLSACAPHPSGRRVAPNNKRLDPMRRIGSIVARKRLDAMNPTRQRRIISFHGQKTRPEFGGGCSIQSAPQQLDPRKNHHVERGIMGAHDPFFLAQSPLDRT